MHQGSVLSPLLLIIVLEALSREFREGLPMELLHADDLVLMAELEELLLEKMRKWKNYYLILYLSLFTQCQTHT